MKIRNEIAFVALYLAITAPAALRADFIRGDANRDGRVTLSDAALVIDQFLPSRPGVAISCQDSADANDNGTMEIVDAIDILRWTFGLSAELPPPFPGPGTDPSPDALACADGAASSRIRDPAYGLSWTYPPRVSQGQRSVEMFLRATTGGPIEGFSISYWLDSMSLDIVDVDFQGTILPRAQADLLEVSDFFRWNIVPTLIPENSILTAGAVFVTEEPLVRLDFAATNRALDDEPLLRIVANIPPFTAAAGAQKTVLWAHDDVEPGANEFSVGGTAILAATMEGVKPFYIDAGEFIRGDVNLDLVVDMSDAIFTLHYLYMGEPGPTCMKTADVNDDSVVDLSDAIYALYFRFLGGPPPPTPTECGKDPSGDDLECPFDTCEH